MTIDRLLFGFLALIHLLPALAAIAPQQISKLYGVDASDSALITLLQHRAVLLGIVGFAFSVAVFRPDSSAAWHAMIIGSISMITFLLIATINRELFGNLQRIVIVDAIGLLPLLILFMRQPWARSF